MSTGTEHDVERRLQAAMPSPGLPPDVAALWHQAQRKRWGRRVGGAVAVGVIAAGAAVVLPPQAAVELSPGAGGAGAPELASDDERYCAEADSFLGTVTADGSAVGDPGEVPTEGFDFQASHETMTQEFARAAAAAPAELAEAWEALQADLEAQGEVWASVDWDPEQAGGFPALMRQLNSLPTSAAGSDAMKTLTSDYVSRCASD